MACKTCKLDEKEFVYTYKLMKEALDENKITFKVIGPDGFKWSEASNAKGALLGAIGSGVQLRDIEIKMFVRDFGEVLARAYGGA